MKGTVLCFGFAIAVATKVALSWASQHASAKSPTSDSPGSSKTSECIAFGFRRLKSLEEAPKTPPCKLCKLFDG